MKYSILMPYLKRSRQLMSTLETFSNLYGHRNDFEIIIIVDNKNNNKDQENLNTVIYLFTNLTIRLIPGTNKESFSPASNYNIGAKAAIGEYLILTNPESMHTVDVLSGLSSCINPDSYIICSCLSVDMAALSNSDEIDGVWYQHSVHRNTGCHFCSVIHRDKYSQIGGFSEEFSQGIGFDDDDFRNKIQQSGISFVYRDDLVTLHLSHDKDKHDHTRYMHNKNLYNSKWGVDSFRAEQLPINSIVHKAVVRNGNN